MAKISEWIEQMQAAQTKHGDLEVYLADWDTCRNQEVELDRLVFVASPDSPEAMPCNEMDQDIQYPNFIFGGYPSHG